MPVWQMKVGRPFVAEMRQKLHSLIISRVTGPKLTKFVYDVAESLLCNILEAI